MKEREDKHILFNNFFMKERTNDTLHNCRVLFIYSDSKGMKEEGDENSEAMQTSYFRFR